jgi:hypothetical protein
MSKLVPGKFVPANDFLTMLAESLREFDQRLLAVEQQVMESEQAAKGRPTVKAGDTVLCTAARCDSHLMPGDYYVVQATLPTAGAPFLTGELRIGGYWFRADHFVFHSRPDRAHHEAEPTAQNDDFLAPPLPWWARSPKIG